MSAGTELAPPLDLTADSPPRPRLRWWQEALFVAAFYAAYTAIRDIRGSRPVSRLQAFHNAERVIRAERLFGLFQERRIQSWLLHSHFVVRFLDDFYGSAHFIVTIIALVYLFRWQPWRYPLWRNTLAFTTALALIGFAFFPLMPPRLLPESYHFVDTLKAVGGLWSFDSGPMNAVSNQYAAMPSLHFAWSSWCALVLGPAVKHRWAKVIIYAYPFVTLFCIVVTGNHYILDAVGGAAILAVGFGLGWVLTKLIDARTARKIVAG
ncbi:MAG TPA: phosphatase PAP2 family protein [Acidimicrobiales bacterium]|nr:phosphatase PAP2 family protein [Acidimicrobiales bacterium]